MDKARRDEIRAGDSFSREELMELLDAQATRDNYRAACHLRGLAYDRMAAKASRLRNRIKQLEHDAREADDLWVAAKTWCNAWKDCCESVRGERSISAELRAQLGSTIRELDYARSLRKLDAERFADTESAYIERDADRLKTIESLKARLARVSAIAEEPAFIPPPHANAEVHKRIMARLAKMTPGQVFETSVRAGICTPDGRLTEHYAEEPATTATMDCDPVYVGKEAE